MAAMAMAVWTPLFVARRPPQLLRLLSSQAPARRRYFLGLLLLQPRSSSSSTSCQYPPEVVPSTDGACQGGDAEQGKNAPANAPEKGVAATMAAAVRRRPAAPKGRTGGAPGQGSRGRTTKPKSGGPTPPGNPKEGKGGNGGAIHEAPDAASSSSSSSSS